MKKTCGKRSFREKFSYWFDNIMSKGTVSLVGILFLITFLVVVIAGILAVLFDGGTVSDIGSSIWVSLMHAIDAGTITGHSGTFAYMLLMTIVTVCGLFITSVLIGIINTGMQGKMESLRKGKSRVLAENHTVILGRSDNTYTILTELIEANSDCGGCVVIMDDSISKEEMEDNIRQRIPDTGKTKIICRCGNIAEFSDLEVCSPELAKSIIINSENDFLTIKSILAVTSILKKHNNTSTFITGIVSDEENYEAALIAGEDRAEILFFDDTIARIVANTCRQPGLSTIYTELFSFKGNEIYLEKIPGTAGMTVSQLNLRFKDSAVLGMEKDGQIWLNPPHDMVCGENDRLIVLAEGRGTSVLSEKAAVFRPELISKASENSHESRHKMLILGYSPRLGKILLEEDKYMEKGSEIYIAVQEEFEDELMQRPGSEYENISVDYTFCNIYSRKVLTELLKWEPDSVFVASSMQDDPETDDSKTLLLLLNLRAISREMGMKHSVTSEMRSAANQALAQITEVKDFVISNNITCHMLTQISQTRELRRIFKELLSDEGSEIYMRPAEDYVLLNEKLDLYTAAKAAAGKNQVFMGYSLAQEGSFSIVINPSKNEEIAFKPGDRFIVLSED